MWMPPLLSFPHWMGNLYLRSLLSHLIKGIFHIRRPRSNHPVANFSLLNTAGSSGSRDVLSHRSRSILHVAIDPSGPHHFSQWATQIFIHASSPCEMNHSHIFISFFITAFDLCDLYTFSRFEIAVLFAQVWIMKLFQAVDLPETSSQPSKAVGL